MAQREREWPCPMLFQKSCTSQTVNAWLEQMPVPELTRPIIVIFDNAHFAILK
jgi:hypothetical protein